MNLNSKFSNVSYTLDEEKFSFYFFHVKRFGNENQNMLEEYDGICTESNENKRRKYAQNTFTNFCQIFVDDIPTLCKIETVT